jgi:hypothetical protein
MPEGDKEAQVPRHGVDVAAKVGLQAAQSGHQVCPAVCASVRLRNLMNLLHQYRAASLRLQAKTEKLVLDAEPLHIQLFTLSSPSLVFTAK